MKDNKSTYSQLTQHQRYQISAFRQTGMTIRKISEKIGCHFSTISRELKRNVNKEQYDPEYAHRLSCVRRKNALKANKVSGKTYRFLKSFLLLGWSPEAISLRMRHEQIEGNLSTSTLYTRIAANKHLGGKLYKHLPRYGKTRWKGGRRRKAGVSHIPQRVDITERPAIVEERGRIGDWEGDTVHGKSAHLVTLVDRKSRLTLCAKVPSKSKEIVAAAIIKLLSKVPVAHTLTLDNGGEFADHGKIQQLTGVKPFFAKPYASWQRGTNENTNGRLRRLWPKKFDMGAISEQEIKREILCLNLTPRKVLNGLTPLEAFTGKRVALIT